ncbi:MAG: hypothetical protein KAH10_08305 [Flavobacteriales bacterium]|nr:hypothetical protein [Flavobacteriales bacterium]
MKKHLLTLIVLVLTGPLLIAQSINQDKIVKKTGDIINCKVRNIGTESIRYIFEEKPDLSLEIDVYKIKKIILEEGKELDFAKNNFEDKENYGSDSKNAFKIDFLSPLYGYTEIAYERSIKPGQSAEIALGIIGWGKDLAGDSPSGAFVKLGYKFMRTPDYYINKLKYAHILKGAYVMPELAFRSHSQDKNDAERINIKSIAFNIKVGKQSIFTDTFLIDWYIGAGYGYSDNHDEYSGHYGFITGTDGFPISFTAGLRLGLVFGK